MSNTALETKDCPYCKESINAEATKCKFCGSSVSPERPAHKGVCPFCREKIDGDAIRCKHCRSMLQEDVFGCSCTELLSARSTWELGMPIHPSTRDAAIEPSSPTTPQPVGFGGFTIRCAYFGPVVGRWCCLYHNGRLLSCTQMGGSSIAL
jgi:hypothetical protein